MVQHIPPIKKFPEAPRDQKLGQPFWSGEDAPRSTPIGEEAWRDGSTDDGEQNSDDALYQPG